jgi:hypothetical protein
VKTLYWICVTLTVIMTSGFGYCMHAAFNPYRGAMDEDWLFLACGCVLMAFTGIDCVRKLRQPTT